MHVFVAESYISPTGHFAACDRKCIMAQYAIVFNVSVLNVNLHEKTIEHMLHTPLYLLLT